MTRNIKQNDRTPFCKVCHDAKKPASVYESHWVKDREGKITCPTLNSQECRYCYKNGHTVKFCPVLQAQNKTKEHANWKQKDQERRSKEEEKAKKTKSPTNFGGGFSALADNSDSEEEDTKLQKIKATRQQQSKEEFPALPILEKSAKTAPKLNFADALKKEPEKESIKTALAGTGFKVLTRDSNGTTKVDGAPVIKRKYPPGSWCAESDSDTEDDEDMPPPNVTIRNKSVTFMQGAAIYEEDYVDNSAW